MEDYRRYNIGHEKSFLSDVHDYIFIYIEHHAIDKQVANWNVILYIYLYKTPSFCKKKTTTTKPNAFEDYLDLLIHVYIQHNYVNCLNIYTIYLCELWIQAGKRTFGEQCSDLTLS